MKINPSDNIPFTKSNYVRIRIKDKNIYPIYRNNTVSPMYKIFSIASKNKSPLIIGQDVFMPNEDKIKEDLNNANISFEESNDGELT